VATHLVKPVEELYVESLLHHATKEVQRTSRLPNAVADWIARYKLSETESHVLLLAAKGIEREDIAAIRGCSELTVKKHISNLLQKTGDLSLRKAVKRLLLSHLMGEARATP
jgi:DNA-binding NarL/FixJ family response regulator